MSAVRALYFKWTKGPWSSITHTVCDFTIIIAVPKYEAEVDLNFIVQGREDADRGYYMKRRVLKTEPADPRMECFTASRPFPPSSWPDLEGVPGLYRNGGLL
jgi:hypothetical protein